MSDINTQLRDYFDANIERVTVEDIFAGQRVTQQAVPVRPKWTPTPRLAVALGFAVTALVVGGSLGLGLIIRRPGTDVVSGDITISLMSGTPNTTGWALVGIAAALVALAVVFMVLAVRSSKRGSRRKEEEMATTYDAPPADHRLEESNRTNRWLVAAVVVLAVALVALGAWVVNDLTTEDPLAVPTELETLLDDYTAAWNSYNGDAIRPYIREMDYVHTSFGDRYTADDVVRMIDSSAAYGSKIEVIGDRLIIGDGDDWKYIVVPNRIVTNADPEGDVGFSTFTVKDTGNGDWRIVRHAYVGDVPG